MNVRMVMLDREILNKDEFIRDKTDKGKKYKWVMFVRKSNIDTEERFTL